MKQYKLLKDLPFAKAGDMVEMWSDGTMAFVGEPNLPRFNKEDVRMFPLWFEEVKEPKIFYTIDIFGFRVLEVEIDVYIKEIIENLKTQGLLFHTEEEAEKYLAYLKAKAIIKQDTKGFKPDWGKSSEIKYCGEWNFKYNKPTIRSATFIKSATLFFGSIEDIEESFKKTP